MDKGRYRFALIRPSLIFGLEDDDFSFLIRIARHFNDSDSIWSIKDSHKNNLKLCGTKLSRAQHNEPYIEEVDEYE